jgi:hypothetical protein
MRHDDLKPIWFNFGYLGYPGWTPVSTFESRLMLQGAQDLVDNNPKEACEHMIARTRNTLLSVATSSGINEHWVSQALLVTAMRGLLGHEIPEAKTWDDDEYD